jgi:hypothetical protein
MKLILTKLRIKLEPGINNNDDNNDNIEQTSNSK